MDEERLKKYKFNKFDWEKDLKNLKIDTKDLESLFDASSYVNEYFAYNKDTNTSLGAKAALLDMSVVLGMDHKGNLQIIKNERGEEGFKFININVIMKMFIKALRVGIMRFAAEERFKLFSEAIEQDLEKAIREVINKYDLNRAERVPVWEKEKKSRLKLNEI